MTAPAKAAKPATKKRTPATKRTQQARRETAVAEDNPIMALSIKAAQMAMNAFHPTPPTAAEFHTQLLNGLKWAIRVHVELYLPSIKDITEQVSPKLMSLVSKHAVGAISEEERQEGVHEILSIPDAYGMNCSPVESQQTSYQSLLEIAGQNRRHFATQPTLTLRAVLDYYRTTYWGNTIQPFLESPSSLDTPNDALHAIVIRLLSSSQQVYRDAPATALEDVPSDTVLGKVSELMAAMERDELVFDHKVLDLKGGADDINRRIANYATAITAEFARLKK